MRFGRCRRSTISWGRGVVVVAVVFVVVVVVVVVVVPPGNYT